MATNQAGIPVIMQGTVNPPIKYTKAKHPHAFLK
jgi:hypothetical protein